MEQLGRADTLTPAPALSASARLQRHTRRLLLTLVNAVRCRSRNAAAASSKRAKHRGVRGDTFTAFTASPPRLHARLLCLPWKQTCLSRRSVVSLCLNTL